MDISLDFKDSTGLPFESRGKCFDPNLVTGKWLKVIGSELHASGWVDHLLDICVVVSQVKDVDMIPTDDSIRKLRFFPLEFH